jgi:hypothetical protein
MRLVSLTKKLINILQGCAVFCVLFIMVIYPFYQPLRFSIATLYFSLPVLINVLLLFCFMVTVLVFFHKKYYASLTFLEIAMAILLCYTLFSIVCTSENITALVMNIRIFAVPIVVFFIVSYLLSKKDIEIACYLLAITCFVVAILYCYEYYDVSYFSIIHHEHGPTNQGLFSWTAHFYKQYPGNYSAEEYGAYSIRVLGAIGDFHATAFFLGIGSILMLLFYLIKKPFSLFYFLGFFLCTCAMFFTDAREAIFSIMVSIIFVFMFTVRFSYKRWGALLGIFFLTYILLYAFSALFRDVIYVIYSSMTGGGLQSSITDFHYQYAGMTSKLFSLIVSHPIKFLVGAGFVPSEQYKYPFYIFANNQDVDLYKFFIVYGALGVGLFALVSFVSLYHGFKKFIQHRACLPFLAALIILAYDLACLHEYINSKLQLAFIVFFMFGVINRWMRLEKLGDSRD